MLIAVANNKGGVGKTAISAHLLFRAAERGLRACGVDLDAQGNFTGSFTARDSTLGRIAADQLFSESSASIEAMETDVENASILPASKMLDTVDSKPGVGPLFAAKTRLRELASKYDLVIVDTAPAPGLRLEAALAAADGVVVPLMPEVYSLQGLDAFITLVNAVRMNVNPALSEPVLVWNMVTKSSTGHRDAMEDVNQLFTTVLDPLSRHVAIADALAERRAVWKRTTSASAAKEWKRMADSIFAHYGILPIPEDA